MKNKIITSIYAVAFIGGFLALYFSGPKPDKVPVANQENQQTTTTKQTWETKTDEQASVTVVVTPIDLSPNSKEWKFNVVMDTHSVELDQDMVKVGVLVDSRGKEYQPVRWEGAEAGGHHREGVLIFSNISPAPESVELKISEISGVVRSFIWEL